MKISSRLYVGITAIAVFLYAHAYPGESIVRDPVTGNYTITYRSDSSAAELSQTLFVPATKIDPSIRSSFRLGERNIITYRYKATNGVSAKQAIVDVVLQQIANPILGEIPFPSGTFPNEAAEKAAYDAYNAAVKAATASPLNWDGDISRDLLQVDWSPNAATFNTSGIHPGRTLSGFGFNSLDLPGVGSSWMAGRVGENEIFGFPDDGPLQDSAVFAELNQLRDNNFVRRNAAVPTIAVPGPFDAAVLLDRIRAHVATWPGKQLVDPAYAAQLDRYLVAATEAYRLNNTKAGREHLKKIRELLEHEHQYLDHDDEDNEDTPEHKAATRFTIDRLAARVLDFDLRYVLKRTEHEHEDGPNRNER